MGALPACASESFQEKAEKFSGDVAAIGDELRALLREVQKSYSRFECLTNNSDQLEGAYDVWSAYGCTEWFEPLPSVDSGVFEGLAEWASRFHRAARVVDTSKIIEGFTSPLNTELVKKLSRCLSPNWDQRLGNELMSAFGTLSEQSEMFTEAVDLWLFQGLVKESDGNEPTVNQLMQNFLLGGQISEFVSWSVADWQKQLAPMRGGKPPSKSTIQGTPVWQKIQSLRKQAGSDLFEHQTERDELGNRRSRL